MPKSGSYPYPTPAFLHASGTAPPASNLIHACCTAQNTVRHVPPRCSEPLWVILSFSKGDIAASSERASVRRWLLRHSHERNVPPLTTDPELIGH